MSAVLGARLAPAQAKPAPATVADPATQVRVVRAEWTKLRALRSTCLFAQLVIGVVGVLAFSGEYGTGMIRAALAVVPSRLPVLWAKLIVLAGLVLPVTLMCAVADFFTATTLLSSRGGSVISLTDPGVLRAVAGSSLYLTVVVIGLALGALLRKTAAGLSVFAAVFFVVPIVVGALPHKITGFAPHRPANAGAAVAPDHPERLRG